MYQRITQLYSVTRTGVKPHRDPRNKKNRKLTYQIKRGQTKLSPPPPHYFKLNFDGSKDQQGKACVGYCIRISSGCLIAAGSLNCESNSILLVEVRGLREGVREALNLEISDLQIEDDNICVIKALKGEWTTPWEISRIILDSLVDLSGCNMAHIRHCFREADKATD